MLIIFLSILADACFIINNENSLWLYKNGIIISYNYSNNV